VLVCSSDTPVSVEPGGPNWGLLEHRLLPALDLARRADERWRNLVGSAHCKFLIAARLPAADLVLEVLDTLERRKDELVRRGQGSRSSTGEFRARANLIDTLRRQEVERVGRQLAAERGVAFHSIEEGKTVRGKLLSSVQLASGRFAMIDDGLGFSLVPWRPVIEDEVGREVMGVMRGGDVSWGRGCGMEL
jgi:Protein of unknown function (DUF3363)